MAEETQSTAPVPEAPKPAGKEKISGTVALLTNSWGIFVKNWLNFVILGIVSFVSTLSITYLLYGLDEAKNVLLTGSASQDALLDITWVTGPIALVLILFMAAVALAVMKLVVSTNEGANENIGSALMYAVKNFVMYIVVSIVFAAAVFLGLVLLIIPGLIVLVWFSLYQPVFVAEGNTTIKALSRSKELVKGYFWAIVGRMVLLGISIAVVTGLLGLIPVASNIASLVISPISIAFLYLIYKDLKKIKG